jgi:hypothetical protein
LFTHLRLGVSSGPFSSGIPSNILYTFFSPIRATCCTHLINVEWHKLLKWHMPADPNPKTTYFSRGQHCDYYVTVNEKTRI